MPPRRGQFVQRRVEFAEAAEDFLQIDVPVAAALEVVLALPRLVRPLAVAGGLQAVHQRALREDH